MGAVLFALLGVACGPGKPADQEPTTSAPEVVEIRLDRSELTTANRRYRFQSEHSALLEIVQLLRAAAEDPAAQAIVLRAEDAGLSLADAQAVVRGIQGLQEAGKPVIFYADSLGNASYLAASYADRIVLSPLGTVDLIGLSTEVLFFKGTLEKLGIRAELVRAGVYKSAVEPYTRERLSPEAEAMLNRILDRLYDQLLDGIARGRGTSREQVRAWIDGGPYTAQEALERGLIDRIEYPTDLVTIAADLLNAAPEEPIPDAQPSPERPEIVYVPDAPEEEPIGDLWSLLRRLGRRPSRPDSDREMIALIYVRGIIVPGREADPFGISDWAPAERILDALKEARDEPTVKAIVLRVDSPGGSALASDRIWQAVQEVRETKPVIVSLGTVAASGGYYVAMGGDTVLAEPATLTGSIGVFGGKFVLDGLYRKLGIRRQVLTRGQHATIYSDGQPLSASERERLEALVQAVYDQFVQKAAKSRNMSPGQVERIAQGQVWTGREAVELGLVDAEGGLLRAFELAKESAGYSVGHRFMLWELPESPSLAEELLRRGWLRTQSHLGEWETLRRALAAYRHLLSPPIFALMPFQLIVR